MRRPVYKEGKRPRGNMAKPKHPPRKLPKVLRDALKAKAASNDPLMVPLGYNDGRAGTKPGRTRMTTTIKDAILAAGGQVGFDGTGIGGLVGYLKYIAMMYPEEFVVLLRAVLPMQMETTNTHNLNVQFRTAEEVQKELAERGIVIDGFLE